MDVHLPFTPAEEEEVMKEESAADSDATDDIF